MSPFLRATMIVNWDHPEVLALASYLAKQGDQPQALIARTFEWVRDQIEHSWEYQKDTVPLKASDVLVNKHGCCFAKSHLLAALLRANGVSTGFAYQRVDNEWGPSAFRLHGFNSVYLPHAGWYDLDARGSKQGMKTQFAPPKISLTHPDADRVRGIWPNPLSCVVDTLVNAAHVRELYQSLPDDSQITPADRSFDPSTDRLSKHFSRPAA